MVLSGSKRSSEIVHRKGVSLRGLIMIGNRGTKSKGEKDHSIEDRD